MLRYSDLLELERWPAEPTNYRGSGGSHGDKSYPSTMPYLELQARLVLVDAVSNDGIELREQVNCDVKIPYLTYPALNALNFISGGNRKYYTDDKTKKNILITYAEWNALNGAMRLLREVGWIEDQTTTPSALSVMK